MIHSIQPVVRQNSQNLGFSGVNLNNESLAMLGIKSAEIITEALPEIEKYSKGVNANLYAFGLNLGMRADTKRRFGGTWGFGK